MNPYVVILDELAVMKRDLYDVIKSVISKRKNTLILLIITSRSTRENIYDERYKYAEKVLNNIYQNDNFLPWIY
ncbi:terminase large subunit domain-containing protein [Spiroplasma endosymbiont of Polydrusus formosus]|uniref:terminase large subunit domain-containing protein n=1 Tax=Spiroplasma endosymbiont of Polydrusus formosus TaxID=3139326 RepID=UPI0035B53F18